MHGVATVSEILLLQHAEGRDSFLLVMLKAMTHSAALVGMHHQDIETYSFEPKVLRNPGKPIPPIYTPFIILLD